MSKARPRQPMPPGLKSQIAFAVMLTAFAIVVLPSALSAGKSPKQSSATTFQSSAGTVTISQKTFLTERFQATSFTDWD